jgi:phasin family protein
MFPIQDQISAAAKANLEAQFALYTSLTNKALESAGKLFTLNITAAKASIEETSVITQQILAAKDPKEVVSLINSLAKPTIDKAIAYGTHVANIASSTQAELTKVTEEQVAEVRRKVSELIDDAAQKAPAGSESLVAFMKSVVGNANAGYEQFAKTSKQAAEAVEANVNSAVTQIVQTVDAAAQKVAVKS